MPTKTKKEVPDPRSEALRHIDTIIAEASEGLSPDDAQHDPSVAAAKAARRLIEQAWTDTRLPEYKVRVFWGSSDAVVRAVGPEQAKNVALSVLPQPTAIRVVVMKENLDRAWEEVASYGDKTL